MNVVMPFRTTDAANGDGIRCTLFVTGCRIHCPNCFNKDAQSFEYGTPFTEEIMNDFIEAAKKPWISGITILGGEPMEPENQKGILELLKKFKEACPDKTVWLYTGYLWDSDLQPEGKRYIKDITDHLITLVDVIVDGPFIEDLKDPSLRFRGSSNQRIIHFNWSTTHDVLIEDENGFRKY